MESNQVIIDPSILVSDEADKRPQEVSYEGFNYQVSQSFSEVVVENDEYGDDPTFEFFTGYLDMHEMESYEDLSATIEETSTFSGFEVEKQYTEDIDYEEVQDHFYNQYPRDSYGKVAEILYDEFVFFFERSWIASRVKKSPNAVTDVPGLRRLIFDRDELDMIAEQVPEEYQNKIQTLKSGKKWKWIGFGIHMTNPLFPGPLGAAIFTAGAVQNSLGLIFDP